MINITQNILKSDRAVFNFILLLLLLLPLSAGAQTQSSFHLKIGAKITHAERLPILNHTGECIAWRSNSSLLLLDNKGGSVAEIKGVFPKHAVSSNGNSIAVLEKSSKSKDSDDERTLAVRWLNRTGQELNRHNLSQHNDDPLPQIVFNAAGSHLLVAYPATARLIFLNNNRQVLREVVLFADALYSNERALFLAASHDAFWVLSQPAPSTNKRVVAPMIVCFSTSGEEQWRRELPAGTAGGLAISDNGPWIAASRYLVTGARIESTISIFNFRGELQTQTEGLFRRAIFAKNGRRLLLMDRRQLRAIGIPRGELLWQINLSQRTEMFVDIAAGATGDKTFALVAENFFKENHFVFEKARLLGFDAKGQQQYETSLTIPLISPMLKYSDNGNLLILAAEGLLQNFTVSPSSK